MITSLLPSLLIFLHLILLPFVYLLLLHHHLLTLCCLHLFLGERLMEDTADLASTVAAHQQEDDEPD